MTTKTKFDKLYRQLQNLLDSGVYGTEEEKRIAADLMAEASPEYIAAASILAKDLGLMPDPSTNPDDVNRTELDGLIDLHLCSPTRARMFVEQLVEIRSRLGESFDRILFNGDELHVLH